MKVYKDSFSDSIIEAFLGKNKISIGGEDYLPFYDEDGFSPRICMAFEIWDKPPYGRLDWDESVLGGVFNSPGDWAKKSIEEFGAEVLCLNLASSSDTGCPDLKSALFSVKSVLDAEPKALIVKGNGHADIDNQILPKIALEFKDENLIIGSVTLENYKTIAVSVLENGHSIIAESPIDINIAKQLNIMLRDLGFPPERIMADPTTGALGYGLEYGCSIMERARLAALSGDKALAHPFINFIGAEAWRVKEAFLYGYIWEAVTAAACILSGCSVAVMRHHKAIESLRKFLNDMLK